MDFFVKLSRNTKVVVPVVAVMALGLFGGSYLIRDSQTAKQEQVETSDEQIELQSYDTEGTVESQPQEQTKMDESEAENETESESEPEDQNQNSVSVTVEVSGSDVRAVLNTEEPGKCYVSYEQNGEKKTKEIGTNSNSCMFSEVYADGRITVTYTSDDEKLTGFGYSE